MMSSFIAPEGIIDLRPQEKNLWYWNLTCCMLHLVQAIAILALGLGDSSAGNFQLPLTTLFLKWENGYPAQDLIVQGYLPFTAVTSTFAWMSSLAHLCVLIWFKQYITDLRRGINQFRWIEYAFSSSVMIGLIAMLFGMYDIISLVLMMAVNACMILFGYMMELNNLGNRGTRVNWSAFYFGAFAGIVPWAAIFAYIGGSPSVAEIPNFVWGILVSYLIMFNTFPVNMLLQYLQVGSWSDEKWGFEYGGYLYGERVYQILSLVAKTLLLWLVYGGTNQPNSYSN